MSVGLVCISITTLSLARIAKNNQERALDNISESTFVRPQFISTACESVWFMGFYCAIFTISITSLSALIIMRLLLGEFVIQLGTL